MRASPLTPLLIACAGVLVATPARAQESEPVVAPLPAPAMTPAATPAPAAPRPQAEDDETPRVRSTAETDTPPAPPPVATGPETSQLALGLVLGVVTVVAAIEVGASRTGNARWWGAGAVLAGGAAATGVVTCALGQTSPTRHGGCGASLAGALIGALGVVPGLLLLESQSSHGCTATGPNADDQCAVNGAVDAFLDLAVAGGGYVLGTAYGARLGWMLGATPRPIAPAANVTLLSLTF